MHKTPFLCTDPQTAVVIAQQPLGLELPHNSQERLSLRFSVDESVDSAAPADQKCAVIVFAKTSYAVRFAA